MSYDSNGCPVVNAHAALSAEMTKQYFDIGKLVDTLYVVVAQLLVESAPYFTQCLFTCDSKFTCEQ